MPFHSSLETASPFITDDGSTIRELVGRVSLPSANQSFAEARVPVGGSTIHHHHVVAEEVYWFTAGRGRLLIGGEEVEVGPGDCFLIPPGTDHKLWNTGEEELVLFCCCSPPYDPADTVLAEPAPAR